MQNRLEDAVQRLLDRQQQRLDLASQRLGRPSGQLARNHLQLSRQAQRLRHAMQMRLQRMDQSGQGLQAQLPAGMRRGLDRRADHLARMELRLQLLDPRLVLQRGYALLTDAEGRPVAEARQAPPGTALQAQLAQGSLDLVVTQPRLL
jgi:exodeoxyribonuclease VII large subunit